MSFAFPGQGFAEGGATGATFGAGGDGGGAAAAACGAAAGEGPAAARGGVPARVSGWPWTPTCEAATATGVAGLCASVRGYGGSASAAG